ncbi:hypothetical protein SY83_01560 [Paenibacillus swuensis]|uniref:ABC transporter substrate-binding protein n=1 Tax=Paenibacillus swuensis TaxID=1178515 RepID=A0A172TDX1_9BACL|nr:extracellular solute-binding protein [Paenibacillus swuensis]ANE45231.1 hypothetical protein SY83_01560 [Paenibacillus swuensis]
MKSIRLTLGFLLFVSGCGQADYTVNYSETQNEPIPHEKTVTVAIRSSGNEDVVEQLLQEYVKNEKKPYHLQVKKIPDDKYEETVNLMMTTGEGPDLMGLTANMLMTYIYKDWLVDLKPMLADQLLEAYPEWAVQYSSKISHDNKLYTLPSSVTTSRMIYNKQLFVKAGLSPDKPPSTWGQLEDYAKQISETGVGDGQYGFAIAAGDDWHGFRQAMEIPAVLSGIELFNPTTNAYDLQDYVPLLQMFKRMKEDGTLFPGFSALKRDTALTQFSDGDIGMMMISSDDLAYLVRKTRQTFSWGVAMPPVEQSALSSEGKLTVQPETSYAVNAFSAHNQEAADLWKFIYSHDFQRKLYMAAGTLPVRKGIVNQGFSTILHAYEFLPGDKDQLDLSEPKFVNDPYRWNAYVSVLEGSADMKEQLRKEADRLNAMYKSK